MAKTTTIEVTKTRTGIRINSSKVIRKPETMAPILAGMDKGSARKLRRALHRAGCVALAATRVRDFV